MRESQQLPSSQPVELPAYHDDTEAAPVVPITRPSGPWWRQRGWLIAIVAVLLAVAVVTSLLVVNLQHNNASTASYQTTPVSQGDLNLSAEATGTVQARTYNVDFSTSDTITEIDVELGQQVHSGQVLAKAGSATLTAPHAGIVTAINGSIGTLTSTIASGNNQTLTGNAPNSFIQLVDVSSLQAIISVNEADLGHVAPGEQVRFTVDAYLGRRLRGTIHSVLPVQQTVNNVVTFPVLMDIDMSNLQGTNLLPGMTVNANITTATRSGVQLIPDEAVSFAQRALSQGLITQGQMQNAMQSAYQLFGQYQQSKGADTWKDDPNQTYVLSLQHGQLVPVPVILGLTDGSFYEVLSGLTANDTVVTGSSGTNTASNTNTNNGLPGSGGK